MLVLGENTTSGWRTALWVRCDAMGSRLRAPYAHHRSLSESDVEDVWSAMLARLVQAPGPNRLPAEADGWPDGQLYKFLRRAFGREIGRAAAKASNSDGVHLHSPLDDLAEETHKRGVIWADAAPVGPEQSVFSRLDAVEYASAIKGDAGPEAATVLFADAMGASASEQQRAVGIATRGRFETVRGRLEIAGNAVSRRAHAVVLWVLPDWLLRWVSALLATGSVPRVGATGLAITALAAGSLGVTTATHHDAAQAPALRPVAGPAVADPFKAAAAPLQTIVAREQARQRAVTTARTQRRKAARRVAERRTRRRAAAKRKVAAEKAAGDRQFSPAAITASPSSATAAGARPSAPSTSSADRSTADGQFGLGG